MAEPFTIGIYEDKWAYVRLLAATARELVDDQTVGTIRILWYRLDQELLTWLEHVDAGTPGAYPHPFGRNPFSIDIGNSGADFASLDKHHVWTGQRDIPQALIGTKADPGKFFRILSAIPAPNVIVVDHELFRQDTAFVVSPGHGHTGGHAHLIVQGLQEYYEGSSHTPPIFLSSIKPLGGQVGIDTLGTGQNQRSRIRWFPRPDEPRPEKLPDGLAHGLREEAAFWHRSRDVFGAARGRVKWRRYDPPFEHIIVYYDQLNLAEDKLKAGQRVIFHEEALSPEDPADAILARHCSSYLEIRKVVTQNDVDRLRRLARRFPLPIVLLYWNTAPNVGSLTGGGVLVHRIEASEATLNQWMAAAATEWVRRMGALDTVIGGRQIRDIRDDLLRWRLGTQDDEESVNTDTSGAGTGGELSRARREPEVRLANSAKPGRHAMLVVGPTGAGKTAVSKWCHFFSGHSSLDDSVVRRLWEEIRVPHAEPQRRLAVPLREACAGNPEFLRAWARALLEHSGSDLPTTQALSDWFGSAFKGGSRRPWHVNLVGVTRHDEFVMQMAGAFPSWSDAVWPNDWRPGAILSATNNSLILNEIGELGGEAQGLLLELIERGGPIRPMFAPIGGDVQAMNVLFIMATDRIERIREQLLYRCRVVRVPSLLECQEDIPELARHRLLRRWCCLSESAEQLMKGWPYWPGNHRSLHAVLDFAAELLPPHGRVIRVPDVIRALWREDLIRIPPRLEGLVKWILDWPELTLDHVEDPVVPHVTARLVRLSPENWTELIDDLNRIANLSLTNPSAHFTNLLRTKNPGEHGEKSEFVSRAIGILLHEILWALTERTKRLQNAIDQRRDKRLDAVPGADVDRQLVKDLLDDAVITLSLGTLLWRVLHIEPVAIEAANRLIRERDHKASGNRARPHIEAQSEGGDVPGSQRNAKKAKKTADPGKARGEPPAFDRTRISQALTLAGQYSLAVVKAFDSPFLGSLFDYAEDRRDRAYFSPRGHEEEDTAS